MKPNPQEAAERLAQYAATCKMRNTLEWMDGLADRLNSYLSSTGATDRIETDGNGLSFVIPPIVYPRLCQIPDDPLPNQKDVP